MEALTLAVLLLHGAEGITRTPQNSIKVNEARDLDEACSAESQTKMLDEIKSKADTSVSACDDFYQHSCGSWINQATIPDDSGGWGTFSELGEANSEVVRAILGRKEGKIHQNYFESCMDEQGVEMQGGEPMIKLIQDLNFKFPAQQGPNWTKEDYSALSEDMCSMYMVGTGAFWDMGTSTSPDHPNTHELYVGQGDLSLPRSTYLDDSEASKEKVAALKAHISRSFELLEGKPETETSSKMVELERNLAKIMWTEADMRDPHSTYNYMSVEKFTSERNLKFPWKNFFGCVYGEGKVSMVDVGMPSFFEKVESVLENTDKSTVARYLKWQVYSAHYTHLSKKFFDEAFSMSQKLSGVKVEPTREKICASRTEGALGDYVSKDYINDIGFGEEDRQTALKMIQHIKKSFIANLKKPDHWMTEETKAKAIDKCNAIHEKIGYPNYIMDSKFVQEKYKGVQADPKGTSYFENHMSSVKNSVQRDIAQLSQKVDKEEWGMTMATVNAYYDPSKNEIVFPAGILRPPFFNKDYHMAYNFGAIGVVMGHELSHGFDDQGSQYDKTGKLANWWSKADETEFNKRTSCMSNQYSQYSVQGEGKMVSVNGNLTLGENIADNGGIHTAWGAYKTFAKENKGTSCSANNFSQLVGDNNVTPEKVYFYGFAQVWCSKTREASIERQCETDPHSPDEWRVKGTAANSKVFSDAFGCAAPSTERCIVW